MDRIDRMGRIAQGGNWSRDKQDETLKGVNGFNMFKGV